MRARGGGPGQHGHFSLLTTHVSATVRRGVAGRVRGENAGCAQASDERALLSLCYYRSVTDPPGRCAQCPSCATLPRQRARARYRGAARFVELSYADAARGSVRALAALAARREAKKGAQIMSIPGEYLPPLRAASVLASDFDVMMLWGEDDAGGQQRCKAQRPARCVSEGGYS